MQSGFFKDSKNVDIPFWKKDSNIANYLFFYVHSCQTIFENI